MSEYIDRNELLKNINENVAEAHNERCAQLLEAVLNAPTADVVEVVRCKDCRYWTGKDYDGCCIKNGLATRYANDYCSYGERREE